MQVLEKAAGRQFEEEMAVHSKAFSPRLCKVIGDGQLRVALRQMMERAAEYGFTNRGSVRLFIELSFLFGSAFENDPQYPWAAGILAGSDDQMVRAEQLFGATVEYQESVSGPDNVNTRKALETLSSSSRQRPPLPSSSEFAHAMLSEMSRIFPQKATYVGEDGLLALIDEGRAESQKYGLPPIEGPGLLTVLMFAFGHGCTDDPLYPWISRTLRSEQIVDGSGRAERLETQSMTWLSHVVAGNRERALS